MRTRPLVSVVVPSFGHERFVGAAVRSVLAQSYRPIELLVVDDGSPDDSLRAIRRERREVVAGRGGPPLERFEIVAQANQGADRAIARGVESSRGELVAVLNSDDRWPPARLERLVPLARESGGVAFSGVSFVDDEDRPLPPEHPWPRWYEDGLRLAATLPSLGLALLLRNFTVSSSNFVFPRALYDRLGGFSSDRFAHDWDFLLRSTFHAEPVRIPEALLAYRVHATNTTERVRDRLEEESLGSLRRFAALCAAPSPNPLAPWPSNWPRFFERFAATHAPAFSDRPLAEILARL